MGSAGSPGGLGPWWVVILVGELSLEIVPDCIEDGFLAPFRPHCGQVLDLGSGGGEGFALHLRDGGLEEVEGFLVAVHRQTTAQTQQT